MTRTDWGRTLASPWWNMSFGLAMGYGFADTFGDRTRHWLSVAGLAVAVGMCAVGFAVRATSPRAPRTPTPTRPTPHNQPLQNIVREFR